MIRYMDKIKVLHAQACDDYMLEHWDSVPKSGRTAFDKLWDKGGLYFRMAFRMG